MTVVPEDPRHKHDRRYSLLDHKHDGRYYTEEETDGLIQDAKDYADDQDDIHSADDRAYTDAETAKRLRWAGVYVTIGQPYEKNDVVRDGEWTMVALVDTTDRPGPEPTGDLVNLLLPWTPTVQNARANVNIRNRWVMSAAGWIGNIGATIEPENVGFSHTLVMYVDGVEQYSVSWVPDTGGEAVQSIPVTIVGTGAEIVVLLIVTTQGNENLYWSEQAGRFDTLPQHTSEAQGSSDGGTTWTTTAYATSLDFQPGTSSPDWEAMSYSGGGGGGGGGGGTSPHEHDDVYVNLTGDTMTGSLILHDHPTEDFQAATKQYVDSVEGINDHGLLINLDGDDHGHYAPIHVIDAADPDPTEHQRPGQIVVRKGVEVNEGLEFLQKQGGTMTGPLILQSDPASDMEAATKQYVDTPTQYTVTEGSGGTITLQRIFLSGGMVYFYIHHTPTSTPGIGTRITGDLPDELLPASALGDVLFLIHEIRGPAYQCSISRAVPYVRWRGSGFPAGGTACAATGFWMVGE